MATVEKGLRVLSFDGPALDVTSLSELFILESIGSTWAWDNEDFDRNGEDIRASEFCDMVGGTGIGGFYAILFAALNMTIGQVISSHKILQGTLFESEEWARKDHGGCISVLNSVLDRVVHQLNEPVDLDGPFLSKSALKCFVCVLNNLDASHARALRNYRVRESTSPNCTIRQAIHATLADCIHLPAMSCQDEQFICAVTGYSNPSYELIQELPMAFPKGPKLACFVSFGAGRRLLPIIRGGMGEELANLVRNAEVTAQYLAALCGDLGPCFFRLSVSVEHFTQYIPEEPVRVVKSLTMGYLKEQDVRVRINDVVGSLVKRHGVVGVQRLGSLAAEDGRAKLNAQIEAVHNVMDNINTAINRSIHSSIKNWLIPIDQTAKLDTSIRIRSKSTCEWLLVNSKIIKWKKMGGIFWLHSGMGTGKTIITSRVIESLRSYQDECTVAYYYFEFTNPATLSEEGLFRSCVAQLSHTNETIMRQLYEQHKQGSHQPQLATLHKALNDLILGSYLPVYVIIDALDELPQSQRKYVLKTLLNFAVLADKGLHIMLTSRDEIDIHQSLSEKVALDFELECEMVSHDIAVFVDQELRVEKWRSWPEDEVLMMRNALITKAEGMFRMVACQLEVLHQTQTTQDMRLALSSLPSTLGDTYRLILDTIPFNLRTRAHTLLCILSVQFEPVSIAELSALLAVELGDPMDDANLPVFRDEGRYHEPQNIIGLGTALVRRIASDRDEVVLQLSHASVKEYLLQDGVKWCGLNERLAHETTARACLALFIHNEDPRPLPLLTDTEYTISHWWRHVDSRARPQLFSQQKRLFAAFPWPRSLVSEWLEPYSFIKDSQSPLGFAAAAGLEQFLVHLLNTSSLWSINHLNDALRFSARMGHPKIFPILVEMGADVNVRCKGEVPALCYAASGTLSGVQYLVEKGADVNINGGFHGSALQEAASQGALDIAQFLVEKGADVNVIGGYHGSALQAAAFRGAFDVVQFLVEKGADVNLKGGSRRSALQAAVEGGRYVSALQAAAAKGAIDIVHFLVEKGADVNVIGGFHGSALQAAADRGAFDVVQFLVEKGADVNLKGGKHGSALQAAAGQGAFDIVQFLVEKGADVNLKGGRHGSALQAAAVRGALDIVHFLVERGADVNLKGGDQGSALQAARTIDVVQFLVEKGADVRAEVSHGWSALRVAACWGALDIVELLVKEGTNVQIERAFLEAVQFGHLHVVEFLVTKGADVNMKADSDESALQIAASRRALDIVRFLVEKGADVEVEGGYYGSALEAAASTGDLDMVELLVERGANVNFQGGAYHSALHAAAACGHFRVVQFLVQKGADIHTCGDSYGSALQAALWMGAWDGAVDRKDGHFPTGWKAAAHKAAARNEALKIAEFLVERGVDVNMKGRYGGSALQEVASEGTLCFVEFLVERGADVNIKGGYHGSALQAAAFQRALDIVQFLVERGADVRVEGGRYGSALQAAAAKGALDIVQFLVERGADVRVEGGHYGSALQAAAAGEALDVIQFLVKKGADVRMKGGHYGSALQAATANGSLDVVRFLVKKGADVRAEGGYYGSALQAAAARGGPDVFWFLVGNGADVRTEGGIYGSTLQAAAAGGALEVVWFLVEKGANVNLKGGYYGSALQAAAAREALDVVRFLIKRGADVGAEGGYYGSVLQAAAARGAFDVVQFLIERGADVGVEGGYYGSALQAAAAVGDLDIVEYLVEEGANVNFKGGHYGSALQATSRRQIIEFLVERGAEGDIEGRL
ncbi:ankyrin repeat-containing domain protein [Flagelloscypha sp. PMI_526]|nr:ankyrin repeat-containing domain protein [Flagelloscypha sp. PMI_526]